LVGVGRVRRKKKKKETKSGRRRWVWKDRGNIVISPFSDFIKGKIGTSGLKS